MKIVNHPIFGPNTPEDIARMERGLIEKEKRIMSISQPRRNKCACGKGHASVHDGKCGHCRSKKEAREYNNNHKMGLYDPVRVVNKYHGEKGEYIGRGSPLGNPWPITDTDDRAKVILMYREWLTEQIRRKNPSVVNELYRLRKLMDQGQLKLMCFCKPLACHGDVIAEVLYSMETPKMLYYAGIGSRETPDVVQGWMESIAEQLAPRWVLRSGFADGADKAFGFGAETANGKMENFLPWIGFNGAPKSGDPRFIVPEMTQEMVDIAARHHPAWNKCSQAAKYMHTRNVCQVLGQDLKTPSKMIICWTPNGSGSGGTGQAIRIAKSYNIPVFDLAFEESKPALVNFINGVLALA